MEASWLCYAIGLLGIGVDGPAVWAVGSMEDCNQVRDGDGVVGVGVGGWR